MRARVVNEIEFNFDKNPTDRYRKSKYSGPSLGPFDNPRKKGGSNLNPEEKEIIDRHLSRIHDLRDKIYNYEGEIQDLETELEYLDTQKFEPEELEAFYVDIQNRYGDKALDILNSGYSNEEKIKAIDELNPTEDFGDKDFKDLIHDYNYYHPAEQNNTEKIKEIEAKIKKLERQKEERQNTLDKLETKVYNLENY